MFIDNNSFYSCEVKTGDCERLFNISEHQSVKSMRYKDLQDLVFIEIGGRISPDTDHYLLMYDGRMQKVVELLQLDPHERLARNYAQVDQARSTLLVQTNKCALLFDLKTGESTASFDLDPNQPSKCYLSEAGNTVLTKVVKDLFVYSVAKGEQRHIFRAPLRTTVDVKLSTRGDKVLIYTLKDGYIYDVEKEITHVIWSDDRDQVIRKAYFNKAEDMVVLDLTNQVHLYDINAHHIKGSFIGEDQEFFDGYACLNKDETSMFINLFGRLVHWSITGMDIWNQLNVEQLDFIQKASVSWQKRKPHVVKHGENRLYESLPDQLKQKRFFL